ncbi:MAG: hypothetical protein ACRCZO_17595 [Cetobacterium sp.]
MIPNFTYRKVKPVYRVEDNGDVIDTRNGNVIKVNEKLLIKLETLNGGYTHVKVQSIYAVAILGSRSRTNKVLAHYAYENK